jgi:hypothetical protein
MIRVSLAILALTINTQADPVTNRFIRTPGAHEGVGASLLITNQTLWVDWGKGYEQVKPFKLKADWFIYPDKPEWIWLYDGVDLHLLPAIKSAERNRVWWYYRAVPEEVAAALPEKLRKHALSHGYSPQRDVR